MTQRRSIETLFHQPYIFGHFSEIATDEVDLGRWDSSTFEESLGVPYLAVNNPQNNTTSEPDREVL